MHLKGLILEKRGTKEATGCIVHEAWLMRTVSRRRNDQGTMRARERERAEFKEELAARKKPKRDPGMGFKQPQIRISR